MEQEQEHRKKRRLPVGYIWNCKSLFEMDMKCRYFLSRGYDCKPEGHEFNIVICGDDYARRNKKKCKKS